MPLCDYDWYFRLGLEYPFCLVFALFSVFLFGSCWGSFMNVCIWRMPRRESVISAPSHCTVCNADIAWYDNLPVISYLVLRGRCRQCKTHYTARYFLVEVLAGLAFCAYFLKAGLCNQVPGVLASGWIMLLFAIAAGWIDAEHRIIPDALNYPVMVIALILSVVLPEVWGTPSRWTALLYSFLSGILPGAFLLLFSFLGEKMAGKEVLGMGDVKFITACGFLLGLPAVFFILMAGSLGGTVFGVLLALKHRRPLKNCSIPFGPFLAAAAVIWLFTGSFLLDLLAVK